MGRAQLDPYIPSLVSLSLSLSLLLTQTGSLHNRPMLLLCSVTFLVAPGNNSLVLPIPILGVWIISVTSFNRSTMFTIFTGSALDLQVFAFCGFSSGIEENDDLGWVLEGHLLD